MITVYRKETGEAVKVHAVDAREMVRMGEYTLIGPGQGEADTAGLLLLEGVSPAVCRKLESLGFKASASLSDITWEELQLQIPSAALSAGGWGELSAWHAAARARRETINANLLPNPGARRRRGQADAE